MQLTLNVFKQKVKGVKYQNMTSKILNEKKSEKSKNFWTLY